jgi:hypothetical protein
MIVLLKMLAIGAVLAAQQNICITSCGPETKPPGHHKCVETCGPEVAAPATCSNSFDLSQACNSQYLGML